MAIFFYSRLRSGKTKQKFKLNKISLINLSKKLKDLKRYGWLNEINSQVIQQAAMDLMVAFQNFFKKEAGFPRFERKSGEQSFRVPQHFSLDIEDGRVFIPKLKTGIKIVLHRELPNGATIKSLTFKKTSSGKYFVSILVNSESGFVTQVKNVLKRASIGIDLGLTKREGFNDLFGAIAGTYGA